MLKVLIVLPLLLLMLSMCSKAAFFADEHHVAQTPPHVMSVREPTDLEMAEVDQQARPSSFEIPATPTVARVGTPFHPHLEVRRSSSNHGLRAGGAPRERSENPVTGTSSASSSESEPADSSDDELLGEVEFGDRDFAPAHTVPPPGFQAFSQEGHGRLSPAALRVPTPTVASAAARSPLRLDLSAEGASSRLHSPVARSDQSAFSESPHHAAAEAAAEGIEAGIFSSFHHGVGGNGLIKGGGVPAVVDIISGRSADLGKSSMAHVGALVGGDTSDHDADADDEEDSEEEPPQQVKRARGPGAAAAAPAYHTADGPFAPEGWLPQGWDHIHDFNHGVPPLVPAFARGFDHKLDAEMGPRN